MCITFSFSGICAAIKLKKELDIDAQLFELSKDVGGTWYSNTYPGAECDIPSHLYSLSFELNDSKFSHYFFFSFYFKHTYIRQL